MIDKLIIATLNKNKLKEITFLLENSVKEIILLPENTKEPIENASTFLGNAKIKAYNAYSLLKLPSLGDDTGLCVDYLNGSPGIKSKRHAGENRTDEDKINKLLSELKYANTPELRKAYFITSAVLVINENYYIAVEEKVYGTISHKPIGKNGFGYDPIFIPQGQNKTYAELSFEEKSNISHRNKCIKKLKNILDYVFNH